MIRITVEIRGETDDAQGIKEKLAMDLERYGDVRVVDVAEGGKKQIMLEGMEEWQT